MSMKISALAPVGLWLALVGATFFVFEAPWRFIDQGPVLKLDRLGEPSRPWVHHNVEVSQASEDPDPTIVLAASTAAKLPILAAEIERSSRYGHLKIELDGRSVGLSPGEEPWERPQLVILSFDQARHPLGFWPRKVLSVDEDFAWRRLREIFPVHPDTSAFRVLLYNAARAGQFAVRDLEVSALQERGVFSGLRYILAGAWVVGLLGSAIVLSRLRASTLGKSLILALAASILLATLMPQPRYGAVVAMIQQAANEISSPSAGTREPSGAPRTGSSDAMTSAPAQKPARGASARLAQDSSGSALDPARKPGARPDRPGEKLLPATVSFKELSHFLAFLLISLVSFLCFCRCPATSIWVFLVLFATSSETLQLFLSTRSSSSSDLAIDILGIASGWLISLVVLAAVFWFHKIRRSDA